MAGTAVRRWWPVLLVAFCFPVASAATMSITGGALGSGAGTPAACSSTPALVPNVGTASPNTTNIVSVDVSGIAATCAGGTVRVAVSNNTDAVQEATAAIPAGGGNVRLTLTTAVPLKDSVFLAVTVQGP